MTAEDILYKQPRNGIHDFYYEDEQIISAMQEYARLKCQELLEIVAKKAKIIESVNFGWKKIDKNSILNAVDLNSFIK